MDERSAEVLSQQYNIIAMVIFCCSRFICTFILRYLNAGMLLGILAVAACCFTCGVIFFQNIWGEETTIKIQGRHDPVIVPRAVVVVESMAALTILDALLLNMTARLDSVVDFYTPNKI